jgi:hypothetical protein
MATTTKRKSSIKNAREVFWAWELGEKHDATLACWTDGVNIYSYRTPLVVAVPGTIGIVLNAAAITRYTTPYQDALRKLAVAAGKAVREVFLGEAAEKPTDLLVAAGYAAPSDVLPVSTPVGVVTPEVEGVPTKAKKAKGPAKLYAFNDELGF